MQPFSAAIGLQASTTSSPGMQCFGPQATKFMPSLAHTTIRERATLFLQSPMKTRVRPLDVVVEVLLNGEDVGEHLGGMPLSGQGHSIRARQR